MCVVCMGYAYVYVLYVVFMCCMICGVYVCCVCVCAVRVWRWSVVLSFPMNLGDFIFLLRSIPHSLGDATVYLELRGS